jgi:hypothetical protein
MSKACQYVTNEVKVNVGMKQINLKDAHAIFQKTITLTEKSGMNGRRFAMKLTRCTKLKTLVKTCFASNAILFQETL